MIRVKAPLRIMVEPQQGATYAQLLAVAQRAEAAGFEGFVRSDHYLPIGGVDGRPGPTDAWITLAGLARETQRIRLGTLVTPVTFRHVGSLAITVAQVDAMSGGRVELGLGTGWSQEEHAACGIPYPESLAVRFEHLEEQLHVLRSLWTHPDGERFSYSGRHVRIEDSPALPKPHQRPHPPIVIGGFGTRRTPQLAAEYGAEHNLPFPSTERFLEVRERVDAACVAVGREPRSLLRSICVVIGCGRDDAEVRRRRETIGRVFPLAFLDHAAMGSVAAVVDRLAGFREAGADRIYLQVLDLGDLDQLDLVAEEVAPAHW